MMNHLTLKKSLLLLILGTSLSAYAGGELQYQNIIAVNVSTRVRFQDSKEVDINCRRNEETGDRECEMVELERVKSETLNNKRIINLATGQRLNNPVARTTVLALAVALESSSSVDLVVYDTTTSNIVARVGTISTSEPMTTHKITCESLEGIRVCGEVDDTFESLAQLTFNTVGTEGFSAINEGTLNLYVNGKVWPDGTPRHVTANGSGSMNITITTQERNDERQLVDETETLRLLIKSVTVTTGRFLAMIPRPI